MDAHSNPNPNPNPNWIQAAQSNQPSQSTLFSRMVRPNKVETANETEIKIFGDLKKVNKARVLCSYEKEVETGATKLYWGEYAQSWLKKCRNSTDPRQTIHSENIPLNPNPNPNPNFNPKLEANNEEPP